MQVQITKINTLPIADLQSLLDESRASGFRSIERLVVEWESGVNPFDKPGEALFIARKNKQIIGICGLNIDPYSDDQYIGRVRHLYVISRERRKGVGRGLVQQVIKEACKHFRYLRLRTSNDDASNFYSALGFTSVYGNSDYTHIFDLMQKP